jgi:hypothetical protein
MKNWCFIGLSFLGSGINEDDAKTLAINDAKRNAIEQAGTYLESHATVLNNRLEKDEITTFSGGLLKIQVLKEERKLVNAMFAIQVSVEAERNRNQKLQAQIAQYPIAYIDRGNAHGCLGNSQAAAEDYNRYLQLNGNQKRRRGDRPSVDPELGVRADVLTPESRE